MSDTEINEKNLVNYLLDYEQDNLSEESTIKLFQYLVDTGKSLGITRALW